MSRILVCSECGGKMERGFVVDTIEFTGKPFDNSYWMEGKPEDDGGGFLKSKDRKRRDIIAYRCESCGFLKFYAGPDNSSEK
jgi:predicted nucleic-acid-binding Zn-ribbon protein